MQKGGSVFGKGGERGELEGEHVCVCARLELFWGKYYKTQTPVSVLLIRMLFAFAFCRQRPKTVASTAGRVGERGEGSGGKVGVTLLLCACVRHI